MHVTWSVHLKCWWFKFFQRKNKVKRSDYGEIKLFSLPQLHIVVIMQKKLRHFFLAVKSLKQIIYLDSRDNFGPVCKNPAFVHIFFFWTTSRGLLPTENLARSVVFFTCNQDSECAHVIQCATWVCLCMHVIVAICMQLWLCLLAILATFVVVFGFVHACFMCNDKKKHQKAHPNAFPCSFLGKLHSNLPLTST